MSSESAIRISMKQMVQDLVKDSALLGVIESVDQAQMLANVKLDKDGLVLYGVRLRALPDGSDQGISVIPAIGSKVVVGMLEGSDNMSCILQYSDVDQVKVLVGNAELTVSDGLVSIDVNGTEIEVSADGISLRRSGEDLLSILQDLTDKVSDLATSISALTVVCAAPGAPSTIPVNVADFATTVTSLSLVKTRMNTLLDG